MITTPGHQIRNVYRFLEEARQAESEDDLCDVVDDAITLLKQVVDDMKPDLIRTFTIELLPGAKINRIGFDEPVCQILDFKGGSGVLVFKVPGGSYFAGRGEQGYAGVRTCAVRVLERVEPTASWQNRPRFKVMEVADAAVKPKASDIDRFVSALEKWGEQS